jgi:hypothetical protein
MFAGAALILALVLAGCPDPNDPDSEGNGAPPVTVKALALDGVFGKPNTGSAPQKDINSSQYEGSIAWKTVEDDTVTDFTGSQFLANTVYRAVLSLTAKSGYTFTGVQANTFTFTGAREVTNDADSGNVTVTFTATESSTNARTTITRLELDASYFTPPAKGSTPDIKPIPENEQYTGTVEWKDIKKDLLLSDTDVFHPKTVYTAVVTLVAKADYTFNGVGENRFSVSGGEAMGISATNRANDNIVYVSFPRTETEPLPGTISLEGDPVLRGTLTVKTSKELEGIELGYTWERSSSIENFNASAEPINAIGPSYTIDAEQRLDVGKYIRVTVYSEEYEGTVSNDTENIRKIGTVQAKRIVNKLSLGGLFSPPVVGASINAVADKVIDTEQYTGVIEWYNASGTQVNGEAFKANMQYKAIVRLTERSISIDKENATNYYYDYTFEGLAANTFYYTGASATNEANEGVITVIFNRTPAAGPAIINDLTLDGLFNAPKRGDFPSDYEPARPVTSSQWEITAHEWRYANGNGLGTRPFDLGVIYQVIVTFAPKDDSKFTFQGAGNFTYEGVKISQTTNSFNNPVVTIVFPPVIEDSMLFVGFDHAADIVLYNVSKSDDPSFDLSFDPNGAVDLKLTKFPQTNLEHKNITIGASDVYTDVFWYVDGEARGRESKQITISADNFDIGQHHLTFTGRRGGNLYSKKIIFTVKF